MKVQHQETLEMNTCPDPTVGIRVTYNAGSGNFTAVGDLRITRTRHPRDYGLPLAAGAAEAALKWVQKHVQYQAELLPTVIVFDGDHYFSYRITGPKLVDPANGHDFV